MRKSAIAMLMFLEMLKTVPQTFTASGLVQLTDYGKNANIQTSITGLQKKLITLLLRKLITRLLRLCGYVIKSIEAEEKTIQGRALITLEAANFWDYGSFKHRSLDEKYTRVNEEVKVANCTLSDKLRHCLNAKAGQSSK
jgi:hypothetical protein